MVEGRNRMVEKLAIIVRSPKFEQNVSERTTGYSAKLILESGTRISLSNRLVGRERESPSLPIWLYYCRDTASNTWPTYISPTDDWTRQLLNENWRMDTKLIEPTKADGWKEQGGLAIESAKNTYDESLDQIGDKFAIFMNYYRKHHIILILSRNWNFVWLRESVYKLSLIPSNHRLNIQHIYFFILYRK